jgi:hypothetical protein
MAKGWYIIKGVQDGDRTVEEQLTGLGTICANAPGKTVLDLGCAEGLIGLHLVQQCHAATVHGFSLVASEIEVGQRLCAGLPIRLQEANLNEAAQWVPHAGPRYDMVLLLSILHKFKKPGDVLDLALQRAGDWVAVRLPAPVINDTRSGNVPFDVRPVLAKDFELVETPRGPRNEWQTLWRRRT